MGLLQDIKDILTRGTRFEQNTEKTVKPFRYDEIEFHRLQGEPIGEMLKKKKVLA